MKEWISCLDRVKKNKLEEQNCEQPEWTAWHLCSEMHIRLQRSVGQMYWIVLSSWFPNGIAATDLNETAPLEWPHPCNITSFLQAIVAGVGELTNPNWACEFVLEGTINLNREDVNLRTIGSSHTSLFGPKNQKGLLAIGVKSEEILSTSPLVAESSSDWVQQTLWEKDFISCILFYPQYSVWHTQ
jgi:hypothetical protein